MSEKCCFFLSAPGTENKTDFLKRTVWQFEQGPESCLIPGIVSLAEANIFLLILNRQHFDVASDIYLFECLWAWEVEVARPAR